MIYFVLMRGCTALCVALTTQLVDILLLLVQQQGTSATILVTAFSYSNGDSYTGHMSNGHPHGEGVMVYAGGEEYSGLWQRGKHHGRGVKSWGDGIVYTGEWQVKAHLQCCVQT